MGAFQKVFREIPMRVSLWEVLVTPSHISSSFWSKPSHVKFRHLADKLLATL